MHLASHTKESGHSPKDLEAAVETKDIGVSGAGSLPGQDCGEPVSRKTSGTEFLLNQEPPLCRKSTTLLSVLLPETTTSPSHIPQAPMESSDVELDLQRSVQAVLRELSAQAPALQSNQGMWRWSLHKKVERDPGKSPVLVRILLRELEKAESEDLRHVIIPLLHTLLYVLTKAIGITEELYQRTYNFCTRLLTLPAPYCTVALDCAIRLKTETAVPGTLYQRLIIAEQNLTSELYPYQERVFLFVDPELVSPSVCSALLLEIEAAQVHQTPEACMRHVVSHALQAALGDACHASALQRKLKENLKKCMHVSQKRKQKSLAPLHRDRTATNTVVCSLNQTENAHHRSCCPVSVSCVPGAALNASRVSHLRILTTVVFPWQRNGGPKRFSDWPVCLGDPLARKKVPGTGPDGSPCPQEPASCRHSELRELATFLGRADPWYQSTVNTLCPAIHKLAEMPPSLDTSRTVDPFILDVITYYVRMGTQPIYFQMYTVKIFRDLSQDPTEDIFLTELKVKIQDSKFPKDGFSPRRKGAAEGPGAELSICYQKALLSHRTQEVTGSLRATGLVLKALPTSDTDGSGPTHAPPSAAPVTDHMCLNVSVTEVVKSSNLAGRSFSTVTNTFRTATIQIQSQDQRLLTLLLDKDSRRTYRDVVRFEVAPCPEPCSGAHKSKAPWLGSQRPEGDGTKAKPKPLLMPINTFSGIVQ
ncbi:phosphoinositide 3-kinase regulatory subunit 6 [Ailuropoda melanoleuca]|uniref:phosphoinositide 3-kinase regulatory subunit 6 n=1 Tax=Ailuropoda melanoleuca TaxID=9646 RepID=UPI001494DBCF|nr:phosphoinositide 3-kinase regulatory subunit 6 [Ailuropoda melanoleuca]